MVRTKPTNQNLQMGFALANAGEEQATEATNSDWRRAALNAGYAAANLHQFLTTDEIWKELTDSVGREWHPDNDSRAMAGVVRELVKKGVIVTTGNRIPSKRASTHAGWHTEYRSLVYRGRQSA